jgi:hypothetical protein
MRTRGWVVAGLAWLGVVVAASALTWTVIESAGEGVLRDPEPVTVVVAGAESESSTTGPTPTPSPTKRPHDKEQEETDGVSPSPDAASSSSPSPAPAPTREPDPAPAATHVRTWRGAAGLVSARCTGSRASLQGASPAAGWNVEVEARGPEAVVVELKTVGEAEREVKVVARCAGGQPHFTVESDAGGDD